MTDDDIIEGLIFAGMVAFFLLVMGALSGCSTLTSPENELRLTCYDGTGSNSGLVAPDFEGHVSGCRVVQVGHVDACVEILEGSSRVWTCSIEGFQVPGQGKPVNDYSQEVR